MPYSLSYDNLPDNIGKWDGLPLSINYDEVMPLDYQAGQTGWLLYGRHLKKKQLSLFQSLLGQPIVVVSAWKIKDFQIVRLAGVLPRKSKRIADEMNLDIAPIGATPSLKQPGLLVLDMDLTAISINCIDEIAKIIGVSDTMQEIARKAHIGSIDLTTSLRSRVALLKNTEISVLDSIKNNLPLTPGLMYLAKQLHTFNWSLAIATRGLSFYVDSLKNKLKLVSTCANQLGIKNNKLTGRLIGDIVDGPYKSQYLINLAKELNIPMNQTVAIGDSVNDLPMLKSSGLGIAYHADLKVANKVDLSIKHADLTGVLCVLSASISQKSR